MATSHVLLTLLVLAVISPAVEAQNNNPLCLLIDIGNTQVDFIVDVIKQVVTFFAGIFGC